MQTRGGRCKVIPLCFFKPNIMTNRVTLFIITLLFTAFSFNSNVFSQVGLSVSPPRVYYNLNAGETGTQKVLVSNMSKTSPLNIGVTFESWEYDELGNNTFPEDSVTQTCVDWISVPEGSYFTLNPGENKEVDIAMTVPADVSENAQTAMVFFTQMNPVDGVNEEGTQIKINVRSGIKVYRKGNAPETRKLEIDSFSFDKNNNSLTLSFKNDGNTWINGGAFTSLLNSTSGEEIKVEPTAFYTMPNDHRILNIKLPQDLEKTSYIATVMLDFGDEREVTAAELQFSYE